MSGLENLLGSGAKLFTPGPKVHKIPSPLRDWIWKEGASGIGPLTILPFVFPVINLNAHDWYERNASVVTKQYAASPGAGIGTKAWTYDVPAGKMAFLEYLYNSITQYNTVAAAVWAISTIQYVPSGGDAVILSHVHCRCETALSNDTKVTELIGQSMILREGDNINYNYIQPSNQTAYFLCATKITEFEPLI